MSVPSNQGPSDPRLDPRYATSPAYAAASGPPPVTDPHHLLPEHATEIKPRHSWLRTVILIAVVLLAAGIIVWRVLATKQANKETAQKAAAAAARPTPVQVSIVQQETVPVYLTALGTVTAYNSVTINTRVSGQLLQVNFQEGQAVRKGQVLLQIDPRPYQAAVDQAVGTLAKDEANLKDMQAEAERYTALYQAGVVSKEQQQLEISNAGQAVGTIKADQAAIESAKVNLGYTRIVSPIDGVVGLRQVDPGNIVNSGQSTGLVIVNQIHPIAIIFVLPEDQLPQVQAAMKGGKKLVCEAYDRTDAHKIASGTLLTIDNQIDTTTGTAKLKAVFQNTDGSLFPNQFVNIRLILSERPNSIVIPTAAVQSGTQGNYVFVVDPGPTPADKLPKGGAATAANGTAATPAPSSSTDENKKGEAKGPPKAQYHADMVAVQTVLTLGNNTVVQTGELNPGQQVVVDGAENLVDGGNVSPQLAKGPPPAPQNGVGAGASSSTGSTPGSGTSPGQAGTQGSTPSANSTSTDGGAH